MRYFANFFLSIIIWKNAGQILFDG